MATKSIADSSVPHLILKIDNKRPIPASDLGDLLKALARDYSEINDGKILVVESVEEGSILILLHDAIAYTMAHADVIKPYAEVLPRAREY